MEELLKAVHRVDSDRPRDQGISRPARRVGRRQRALVEQGAHWTPLRHRHDRETSPIRQHTGIEQRQDVHVSNRSRDFHRAFEPFTRVVHCRIGSPHFRSDVVVVTQFARVVHDGTAPTPRMSTTSSPRW